MIPRIDAHQHFWRIARGDYAWLTPALGAIYRDFNPDDLAPHLAAHGIAASILVQAAPECVDLAVIAAALTDEGRGLDCRARFGRWPGFPVRCNKGCPLPVPHPRRVSSAGRATHL